MMRERVNITNTNQNLRKQQSLHVCIILFNPHSHLMKKVFNPLLTDRKTETVWARSQNKYKSQDLSPNLSDSKTWALFTVEVQPSE
jgi:hypothetical protein